MAYSNIDKPNQYFNTVTYTGAGTTTQSVTGVGFQPDWIWIKNRSAAYSHAIQDVVRGFGATYNLASNSTNAEGASGATGDNYGHVSTADSDGFTVTHTINGSNDGGTIRKGTHYLNDNYVAWNWKAGGTASSNTDGSITSSVSANTTAGFSIVSWTGNATDSTIGHGLNSAPQFIIVKNRTDSGNDWRIGQTVSLDAKTMTDGNGYYLDLNDIKASTNPGSAVLWGATPTAPTSSVFTVGTNNGINGSGDDMLAYCFHSVKGYSKIGTYAGNGSSNGPFIYTGFKPAMVITKPISHANNYNMFDNARNPVNAINKRVYPNLSAAEQSGTAKLNFLSNGFKPRNNNDNYNASGYTYLYYAVAENPMVTSGGTPATAR